jgi:hypothetical protein
MAPDSRIGEGGGAIAGKLTHKSRYIFLESLKNRHGHWESYESYALSIFLLSGGVSSPVHIKYMVKVACLHVCIKLYMHFSELLTNTVQNYSASNICNYKYKMCKRHKYSLYTE